MVPRASLFTSTRPPRPASQALRPRPCIHRINIRIGEHDAAPAPHSGAPSKTDGRQCDPARIRAATMRDEKGKDSVRYEQT
jgi:hypothetical protein